MARVGSWWWQTQLLGMTALGALVGVVAVIGKLVGHPPKWAEDGRL